MNPELIPNVDVPEGESGNWKIERFSVGEADVKLHNLRCLYSPGMGRRTLKPGTYTRLTNRGNVIMSDTPAEKSDHYWAVRRAGGVILINGLGLGMVLNACLLKTEVQKAIVVEKSDDVIRLAGPHYQNKFGNRLEIAHADAMEYKPAKGMRFGMVWHDIWNDLCADNLTEMTKLHRRYGKRAEWQGSWGKELCQFSAR